MAGVQAGDADAGQTSGTSAGDHQTIQVTDLMLNDGVKDKLKSLDIALIDNTAVAEEEQTNKPTIPRVPYDLVEFHQRDTFYPTVVSIGPFYRSRYCYYDAGSLGVTKEVKIKLAAIFIKEHEIKKEDLYRKIKMEIEDLKNCYDHYIIDIDYNDDDFVWMFLIDGCVVLHFIYIMKYGYNIKSRKYEGLEILLSLSERIRFQKDIMSVFQKDIMLLVNQLPYQLLRLIIDSSKESDRKKLKKSIQDSMLSMMWDDQPVDNQVLEKNQESALHLLDFFWKMVTCIRTNKKPSVMERITGWLLKILGKPIDILMNFITLNLLNKITGFRRTFNLPNLRSVEDLKEAGVELKLNITDSLMDIKFNHGILHLPLIVVDDETKWKLLNLMAYEVLRSNTLHNYEVCSYIVFLASLIDRPADVKELRVQGILRNHFESDKNVVEHFKRIKIDNLDVPFVYKYPEILDKIGEYYGKRRYRVWMAQFKTRYFESPWSVIALFGATMVLVLSFLQTYYTILGYYKG